MQDKYLGDSYDLVKRFWSESLSSIGMLYAYPKFIPATIRERYTAVTLIPILELESLPKETFGILLDPHTGISLPDGRLTGMRASHVSLPAVVDLFKKISPHYVICFDQGYHRQIERENQRQLKLKFLREHGLYSLYYVSHASFLFVTATPEYLAAIHNRLVFLGIPAGRFSECK